MNYKVWAFRKFHGCYDCGELERMETAPLREPIEMPENEFKAFERAVRKGYSREYVYLYTAPGVDSDDNVRDSVEQLIAVGRKEILDEEERARKRAAKAAEKAAKTKDLEAAKAEKDKREKRKLYEQLKAEFDK